MVLESSIFPMVTSFRELSNKAVLMELEHTNGKMVSSTKVNFKKVFEMVKGS